MKSISLAAVQSRKLMVDSLIELQTSNTQPPVSVEKMSLYTFTERQRERERILFRYTDSGYHSKVI